MRCAIGKNIEQQTVASTRPIPRGTDLWFLLSRASPDASSWSFRWTVCRARAWRLPHW